MQDHAPSLYCREEVTGLIFVESMEQKTSTTCKSAVLASSIPVVRQKKSAGSEPGMELVVQESSRVMVQFS